MAIKDTTVDVEKKSIVVGSFESRDGNGFIHRDPDGTISYARLIKTQAGASEAKKPEKEDAAEWAVQIKHWLWTAFALLLKTECSALRHA